MILVMLALLLVFCVVMCLVTYDMTIMYYLIPSYAGFGTVALGSYFWKAKCENKNKYTQQFITDYADKYGIDVAIRIAESVTKES